MDEGHCGLPTDELVPLAEKLLEVPVELVRTALDLELAEGIVIADSVGETRCVFLAGLYRAERSIAERLLRGFKRGDNNPCTHTIEIDSFVPRSEIDQRFFDTPYYVTPSEPVGQEAFAVIREAMRGKGMVALGRLVLSKRERVIALEPYDKGLLGTTLRYPYEVRKAEDYFCDLPDLTIAPDMLTLAEQILHSKASEFDPATFRDRYEEALLAHLKAKQAGAVPERRKTFAPPHRVVNLMEALRRSVAEDTKGAAARKAASATPARKRA